MKIWDSESEISRYNTSQMCSFASITKGVWSALLALVIVNKMKAMGLNEGETAVVKKILRLMSPKFNYAVCFIE